MSGTAPRAFLTAEWRDLVMLNYEIAPEVLEPLVPDGCELDSWRGRTFVSVVGFRFLDTRLRGLPVPFHRSFEEVNLRFYVRRLVHGEVRRGVVFVKELVPLWAVAFVARYVYGENYVSLPMRHEIGFGGREADPEAERTGAAGSGIEPDSRAGGDGMRIAYRWNRSGTWEGMSVHYSGIPSIPADDSEETFITEHYWGYTRQPDGSTLEYPVEHPRWRVWRAHRPALECDPGSLYGPEFVPALSGPPSTAFVADGSPVVVREGRSLT